MSACVEGVARALDASAAPEPAVHLDPDPARWADLLGAFAPTDDQRRFRAQLGLPTDRPIVMGGHQAQMWHAGILAKVLAANALAERTGAAVAWVVVDQDENDVFRVPYPERDARGRLGRTVWNAAAGSVDANAPGLPAFARPPVRPAPLPPDSASSSMDPWVRARLESARAALGAHADADNAAVQVTDALFDLLTPVTPRPAIIYASALARTDLFARLLTHLRDDPARAHETYNRAVARHPDAGVRALGVDPARGVELPVWRIDADHKRRPAFAADLPNDALCARGMLMSAMLRLAGCDLFIHGTGGRAYEPINDDWLDAWLGHALDGARPAPFVTASADLLLPLGGPGATDDDVRDARWRAHHAQHHPGDLGDAARQRERDALVRTIASLPRHSPERAAKFTDLHRLLTGHRREHDAELGKIAMKALDIERRAAERLPREDRTWAVPLHETGRLLTLRDRIDHEIRGA